MSRGLALAVTLVVAAFWLPVIDAPRFWDDRGTLTDNPWLLADLPTFFEASLRPHLGHWQPLSWWSLRLDRWLFVDVLQLASVGDGAGALSSHLLGNVLLHALGAGALVALIAAVLAAWPASAGLDPRWRAALAALAALLWALHPCRVESVAWATERRDVLATALLLPGLWAYVRWRAGAGGRGALALALGLWTASALAKAWIIALPGAILGLELAYLTGKADARLSAAALREAAGRAAPTLLLAMPVAAIALWAQQRGGATADAAALSLGDRGVLALSGLSRYAALTVYPAPLSPLHPIVPAALWSVANLAAAAAALLGTLALVAWAWRGRGPWPRLALGTALGAAAWLAPVSGLTQSGVQAIAERYLVLAHVPVAIVLAAALAKSLGGAGARIGPRVGAVVTLLALTLAVEAAQTRAWQAVWRAGPEELWSAAIAAEPRSPHALANRAALRLAAGALAAARADLDAALALAPRFANALALAAEFARRDGDLDGALALLDRAVAAAPDDGVARCNRAALRAERGDLHGALADFDAAVGSGAGPDCRLNRAVARVNSGDLDGARADVEAARALLPRDHPLRRRADGMARALATEIASPR